MNIVTIPDLGLTSLEIINQGFAINGIPSSDILENPASWIVVSYVEGELDTRAEQRLTEWIKENGEPAT